MDLTKEELLELIRGGIREEMKGIAKQEIDAGADPEGDPDTNDEPKIGMLQLLEMEGLSEDYKKAIAESVSDLFDQSQKVAAEEAAQMIANMRRKSHVMEFSQRITAGSEENPVGLNTDPDQLTSFILAQTPDNAKYIQELLTKVVQGKGIVEFEELGHGKKVQGTTPLPEPVAANLRSGELKVEDLTDPILGLGELSQYNLSEFKE